MRLFALILSLCAFLYAQQSPQEWWAEASQEQKESVLWYARHYGVSIGAKDVLETSGGKYTDHGEDEDSCGDLGLSMQEAKKRRPRLSERTLRAKLNNDRHFQGKLAKELNDENRQCMRFKKRPELCTAMVYSGWRNWNNEWRLKRGLLDLKWQAFLKTQLK